MGNIQDEHPTRESIIIDKLFSNPSDLSGEDMAYLSNMLLAKDRSNSSDESKEELPPYSHSLEDSALAIGFKTKEEYHEHTIEVDYQFRKMQLKLKRVSEKVEWIEREILSNPLFRRAFIMSHLLLLRDLR